MPDTSALGNRMKLYEGMEAGRILMPGLPILARLDGRAFHTFCRHLSKPFDGGFHTAMVSTTMELMREFGALVGYTQSDEISLLWHVTGPKSEPLFGGKVHKLVSLLAAYASVAFARMYRDRFPTFDCRVWNVPSRAEAANTFLWREFDATRNSILAAGQAKFSHKRMQGMNTKQIRDALFVEHGVNWATDYPAWAKRGTWVLKRRVTRPFSAEEIGQLPPKHEARVNPALTVERWEIRAGKMPRFASVLNREKVLFDGADPVTDADDQEG